MIDVTRREFVWSSILSACAAMLPTLPFGNQRAPEWTASVPRGMFHLRWLTPAAHGRRTVPLPESHLPRGGDRLKLVWVSDDPVSIEEHMNPTLPVTLTESELETLLRTGDLKVTWDCIFPNYSDTPELRVCSIRRTSFSHEDFKNLHSVFEDRAVPRPKSKPEAPPVKLKSIVISRQHAAQMLKWDNFAYAVNYPEPDANVRIERMVNPFYASPIPEFKGYSYSFSKMRASEEIYDLWLDLKIRFIVRDDFSDVIDLIG